MAFALPLSTLTFFAVTFFFDIPSIFIITIERQKITSRGKHRCASLVELRIINESINIIEFLSKYVVSSKEPTNCQDQFCFCPLYGLLDAIGKKWSLLIIAILGNEGEKGFNELKTELDGISPKTLSETLKKLEELKLVKKEVLSTSPPSVRYSLTHDGIALRGHLIPLLKWVSQRGAKEEPWCPIKIQ